MSDFEIAAYVFIALLACLFVTAAIVVRSDKIDRSNNERYVLMRIAVNDYIRDNFHSSFRQFRTCDFSYTDVNDYEAIVLVSARIIGINDTVSVKFMVELINGKYRVKEPKGDEYKHLLK